MSKQSQHNWKHTSLLGSVAMAKEGMNRIMYSPTTTAAQRDLAKMLWSDLATLYNDLSTSRVNLDGQTVVVEPKN